MAGRTDRNDPVPMSRPSLTARHVAAQRIGLDRPAGPFGDAAADVRHQHSVSLGGLVGLGGAGVPMAARTAFFDRVVASAIDGGVTQVVVLGAGYDGRALRFAHPGVTFFEVDRAATQADKRRRLRAVAAATTGITFVTADFTRDDLGAALRDRGFDGARPAVFTCEGLLPYLAPADGERLLRAARTAAGEGSTLACNFHVRPPTHALDARLARGSVDLLLRVIGERRRTTFRPGDPESLLERAGWHVETVETADRERGGHTQFVVAGVTAPPA
jgi:methyltransferase (TIGR00027 family)